MHPKITNGIVQERINMRSEKEMLDLILKTAQEDVRIRAVHLNGSRVNPNAPRDFFQDYDVIYFVTDVNPYKENLEWIKRFGELMILQMPDLMDDPPPEDGEHFTYLMQFSDGNRIDLGIFPLHRLDKFEPESLTVVLLDKDGLFKEILPPSDCDGIPKPPTAKEFFDCCNEFWWVSPYVAKGLWRGEILYAKHMEEVVRTQLMKMLTWYIGMRTGFTINPGKMGKYFQKYLEPELWEMLLGTYIDADYDHTWEALIKMGELFRNLSLAIASHFSFEYPIGDDQRVSAHLLHVRRLPKDVEEMY
jgi:aminoglycoside 6-adenylyltransferase